MRTITAMNMLTVALAILAVALSSPAFAQMGRRFPSEKKVVLDPVTGVPLSFLTSTPAGDAKIYQTHSQWTADGKWLIFRSRRAAGQAFTVNEETGGKAPQRTWTVRADGTGLRPLYPEAPYEWVTHEAVITKDEVAILGHRKPGTHDEWGRPARANMPPAWASSICAPANSTSRDRPKAAAGCGTCTARPMAAGPWATISRAICT